MSVKPPSQDSLHFQKVEISGEIIDQEPTCQEGFGRGRSYSLYSSGTRVADIAGQSYCAARKLLSHAFESASHPPCVLTWTSMNKWRWAFLHHFLVSSLGAALSFTEMDSTTHPIAEHLDLDVTRLGDVFLHEHCCILEKSRSSSFDRRKCRSDL